MKASPLKENFNAGEISPLMAARIRVEKYGNALETCENMIPLVQGGVTRRPGTMFVNECKVQDAYVEDDYVEEDYVTDLPGKVVVVPFEFSVTQAYILEFGDQYIRFYKDRGIIETVPGSPYEVVTPYSNGDITDLKFTQSADVLYITHPSYAPRKLSRTGHTSWTLTVIDFLDGPYLATNITTTTITPAATTGTGIVLTASAATFASTDVGRLVRIKHTSTWGYAKIVSYSSSTSVTADIKSNFGAATASSEWRLGLYCSANGYPSCSMFFEDRLFFAGCTAYPQRIDGSSSGLYETFSPSKTDSTVTDSSALSFSLNAADVNVIRWMQDDEKGLIIGSVGGEWVLRASSLSQALTPTNVTAKRSTAFGSANVTAVRAGRSSIYIQRAGRKVRELAYVYEVDGFRSPDMTVLSEHISESGFVASNYQQEPWSIVWFVRNDGQLVGMTYERDQDVIGWHRHILGGSLGAGDASVESVACIPTPDGTADEAWLVVKRTIDGVDRRYIEYITPRFESNTTEDAFFVDCGLTYDGIAATTISGLDHLEGETVSILSDGATHPDRIVSGGSITLARSATNVHVGLPYLSDVGTLRIEAGAADGTAQGKTKRIHRVAIRLYKTLGLKFGPSADKLDTMTFRTSSDDMGNPPALFTGDKQINWNGYYDTEGKMYFRQDQPLPLTILGLFPQLHTEDR
jgi:hypothetical protein